MAVLTVESDGSTLDDGARDALTESVAAGARDASPCKIITPRDVRSMMAFEAERQQCNLDDASCISEIGAALGVQRIVTTSIHKLDRTNWTASVRLLDIETASVIEGRERVVRGDIIALRTTVNEMGRGVFGAWSTTSVALVGGGAAGAGVGAALAIGGGALLWWSQDTLTRRSASGDDKERALAIYNPAIVGAVAGAGLVVAGGAVAVAGLTVE